MEGPIDAWLAPQDRCYAKIPIDVGRAVLGGGAEFQTCWEEGQLSLDGDDVLLGGKVKSQCG